MCQGEKENARQSLLFPALGGFKHIIKLQGNKKDEMQITH